MTAIHTEKAFEELITAHLVAHGWLAGRDADFDPTLALDRSHLFAFIEATQPDTWAGLRKSHGAALEDKVTDALVKYLDTQGTLFVLRHGFKFYGKQLDVAAFKPAHGMNPSVLANYAANRLVVTRQVHYDPAGGETLDLVLLLNGLPVATVEVKTPTTGQTVEHAKRQYKFDRDARFPLLKFKRGALVHFAVDPDEVFMTTRLSGAKTFFLPLNQGNGNGKGNPPNPQGYRVAYLWERIWERHSFLDIFGRFMHLAVEDKRQVTKDGQIKTVKTETMVFPRYHQLDVVRKLIAATVAEGVGKHYLIQHSAGSGKSNSIAWLAHRLQSLHNASDEKLFDSVVVVTDRRVLDKQLQDTIYQIEHKQGVVTRVSDGSKQLAEALTQGAPIVITTLQKFPFVTEHIAALPNRRYAIIVDEAHSSQSGESARKLREVLGGAGAAPKADGVADGPHPSYGALVDEENEGEDPEDHITRVMLSRGQQPNLSFFAFTATPKHKTLEVFGRTGDDGKPRPFHLYSMRQAIEEQFILDVLEHYTTYKTFYRLAKAAEEDRDVDKQKARSALTRYVSLHPYNISQKTEIMVEHFRKSVRHKINGRAKAMVVAASRLHAVRYKQAFETYLSDKGYADMKCLVAFSGVVKDENGSEFTEVGMNNGVQERELPERFDTDEFQVLLVANKYQTGFDQPLLHTMYVDKRLSGVQAVQTLSRLNRTTAYKDDTFVLDFVNEAEDIHAAFKDYYETTTVLDSVDPHRLYELTATLDAMQVYFVEEVDGFAKVFYNPRATQDQMYRWLNPAVDRWKALPTEEDGKSEAKEEFRAKLNAYVSLYAFLSQVMPFTDADLEKRYSFGRFLLTVLPRTGSGRIELGDDVSLEYYRISKTHEGQIRLAEGEMGELKGPTDTGTAKGPEEEMAPLSEIITLFNERFGTEFGDPERLVLDGVALKLIANPLLKQRAEANTLENFSIASDVKSATTDAMVEHHENHGAMVEKFLDDGEFQATLYKALMRVVYQALRKAG
jgi:type I restriction enzyme R subunit